MTAAPLKKVGTRLCIAVSKDGVTVYGNKHAFRSLAEWMSWIADSNEADHLECHVGMDLEDDGSKFEGREPRNVWVLADKTVVHFFAGRSENNSGFELTFMAVADGDLDDMARFQKTGLLPDGWNQNE